MNQLIPPFDFQHVIVDPWTSGFGTYGWMVLMAFLVTATCGLIGNYLILRRMALVGDAISHSVLPGLAVAYLITSELSIPVMMLGALGAGMITTVVIEFIHTRSRIKSDAAIGITFCTLFAIGVVLINVFAHRVHLDADCVLYGELAFISKGPDEIAPRPVLIMGGVGLVVVALILLFYKELLVSSFDAMLAASLGFKPRLIHLALMAVLSIVIVSAFESVGAILVIAMLILPGATSQLLSTRLPVCLWLSVAHAALSAVLGLHLGVWLDCSIAAAVVVAGTALFGLAWVFGPDGVLARWRRPNASEPVPS